MCCINITSSRDEYQGIQPKCHVCPRDMHSTESQRAMLVLLFTGCNNSSVALGDYECVSPDTRGYCARHARIEKRVSRRRHALFDLAMPVSVSELSFPLKVGVKRKKKEKNNSRAGSRVQRSV